jgi:hypothetical protein
VLVKIIRGLVLAGILSVNTVFAGDTAANYTTSVNGYASFESGEIMKGYSSVTQNPEIQRAWLETGYMGFCADAVVSDHLRVLAGGQAQLLISFRRAEGTMNDAYTQSKQPETVFLITNGEAIYTIGNAVHPLLQVEAGFFPYKYNPDVRNLGEYLFRTYCYPSSIVNQFDYPFAYLTGARIGNSFSAGSGEFHQDLLLTTSTNFWPFMDWSLSYLADYSLPGLFTFGAGVQLWDLFSVGVDNSQVGIDPTTPDSGFLGGKPYTFAGTKLMARFSFDAKGLIPRDAPIAALLGKEDLKLYGEATILGLRNYTDPDTANHDGYDSLLWRMPVMAGFNVPAFKLLDVLAFELEFQDSPYPNSIANPVYDMQPFPAPVEDHAKFKWSLYAKKNLGKHVSIIGQVARDHLMPLSTVIATNYSDYTDVLLRDTDWWWTGKMRFDF